MKPFQMTPRSNDLDFDLGAKNSFLYFVAAGAIVFHKNMHVFFKDKTPSTRAGISYKKGVVTMELSQHTYVMSRFNRLGTHYNKLNKSTLWFTVKS